MKKLFTKLCLLGIMCLIGGNAWAETFIGAEDNTTDYLGAKSEAYAINANGTWTFSFTNYNSGSGSVWNNFLLELSNGINDEFVLRADAYELVRGGSANITRTGYTWVSDAQFINDMNGAAVAMTVTRNGNVITMNSTITPANSTAAFQYDYVYTMAAGNLSLYLSVDHSHISTPVASWEATTGTILETKVVNFNFEDGEKKFTNAGRSGLVVEENATEGSKVLKYTTSSNMTNAEKAWAHYNFADAVSDAQFVKVEMDFNYGEISGTGYLTIGDGDIRTQDVVIPAIGGSQYGSNGAIFAIGNYRASKVNNRSINGDKGNKFAFGTWYHLVVMVDLINKKVDYKVLSLNRQTTITSAYNVNYWSNSAETCSQIDICMGYNSGTSYMDNIVVTSFKDVSAVPTTYTIQYTDGTNVIKTERVENTYVGNEFTATAEDMATFYSADANKKYVYKSGNTTKTAVATAADNVITLVFDTYDKCSYSIKATDGENELKTLGEGTAYTDGSTTVYWPKYINVDGKWYDKGDAPYGKVITSNTNESITFNEVTDKQIAYFASANQINLNNANTASSNYTYVAATWMGVNYSNGLAGCVASGRGSAYVYTSNFSVGGKYKVTVHIAKQRNNTAETLNIKEYTTTVGEVLGTIDITTGSEGKSYTAEVEIPKGSGIALNFNGSSNSNWAFDYVVVEQISVPVTISAARYATFVTPYAMDFTDSEITAYTITSIGESSVTLTSQTTVPAGEAIIVKGATGNVPVIASADPVENRLDYSETDIVYDENANVTYYVLAQQEGQVVFAPVNSGTIAAGKGYFTIAKTSGAAPRFTISFGEETTIEGIQAAKAVESNEVFNLSGQRVSNNFKGIVIKNGAKYLNK